MPTTRAPYTGYFLASPLDQHEACSTLLEVWLTNTKPSGHSEQERRLMYAYAYCAYLVAAGTCYDEPLRHVRVAFDVLHDAPYFIFKQDNNGNTIVVSSFPMALPQRTSTPA